MANVYISARNSPANAETDGRGEGLTRYRFAELAFPSIGMSAGDVLIIDTAKLEIMLNGKNALDKLADDSDPENFRLHPGENRISIDGSGTADIRTAWRDRWL